MVLREILAIAKFIRPEMLVATNFGICATVNGYLEIKAPDWVYVARVNTPGLDRRRLQICAIANSSWSHYYDRRV